MNKKEYIEHLKDAGIYEYITDIVPVPVCLIDKTTGDLIKDDINNPNRGILAARSRRYEKNEDAIEFLKKFDKCYVVFNDLTAEQIVQKNVIRYFGWNKGEKL